MTCTKRTESIPPIIRRQIALFKGHVIGRDVAKAFVITERHGRRLLAGN